VEPRDGAVVFHAKVDDTTLGIGHGHGRGDQVVVGQALPIALEFDRQTFLGWQLKHRSPLAHASI
jgi:hypothetical protein